MYVFCRGIRVLFLAASFLLANFAEASFKSVNDGSFYPEIGHGTDEGHLTLRGSAFTAESRQQVTSAGGLDNAICRFSWVNSAESFREFYSVDYSAAGRASFLGVSASGKIDYAQQESKVRRSANGVFAMDIVVVSHEYGVSFAALRLTPEAKALLLHDREQFHREYNSQVMIGYCKGSRCVSSYKCTEEESLNDMLKNFSCAASAGSGFYSADFSMDQKKTMEKAFKMGSTESVANYVGSPSCVPNKISTCEELQEVFRVIVHHIDKEKGGVKANWISVPYDRIDDYKATVVSLMMPFSMPKLMISNIAQAYKALMEVRYIYDLISNKAPDKGYAKKCLTKCERKIKTIGANLVQDQPVSDEDLDLLDSCVNRVWPEDVAEVLNEINLVESSVLEKRRERFKAKNIKHLEKGVIDEDMFMVLQLHGHDTCWVVEDGVKQALSTIKN